MLNSPAFESQKGLPRTGLPRSSFIIPECSEPRSDPVGVIINCSHTALLQLGTQTFGINSTEELISLNYTILEGEEEGKQFPEMWGGFLLTLPPLGRRSFTPTVELPHNGLCFQSSLPKGGSDPCSTQPSGVLGLSPFSQGFVPPAWRASCPQCHPVLRAPRGQGMLDGRDQQGQGAESSPSKTCQGSPGDSSLCCHPCSLPHLALGCQAGWHTLGTEPGRPPKTFCGHFMGCRDTEGTKCHSPAPLPHIPWHWKSHPGCSGKGQQVKDTLLLKIIFKSINEDVSVSVS